MPTWSWLKRRLEILAMNPAAVVGGGGWGVWGRTLQESQKVKAFWGRDVAKEGKLAAVAARSIIVIVNNPQTRWVV